MHELSSSGVYCGEDRIIIHADITRLTLCHIQ